MSGKPAIYWDSCIFIAWITGEKRIGNQMQAIEEHINKFSVGAKLLITSVITETEILEAGYTQSQRDLIEKVLRNPNNCLLVNVDPRIARLARDLRIKASQKDDAKLTTPDAIHIASAILTKCTEMHTFDEKVTRWDGLFGIRICHPPSESPLFDALNAEEKTSGATQEEAN